MTSTTDADARPSGLRRDAAHNRQLLIDAAEALFAARGLGVSLDDIARHAGVGVGTAYRRFANKQELIVALFERKLAEVTAIAATSAAQPDALAGLEEFLTSVFAMMAANRGLREIMISANIDPAHKQHSTVEITDILRGLVDRARSAGQVRADFVATDIGVLFWMIGATLDYTDAGTEVWSRHLRIWLDGISTNPSAVPWPGTALSQQDFDLCSERASVEYRGRNAR